MILSSKTNEFAHLVLCIITADTLWHIIHTDTVRTLLDKFWIFLYLYTPCLIVYKMKMKSIKLITCHLNDKALQVFKWNKMANRIDHQLTNCRTWLVRDKECRYLRRTCRNTITNTELFKCHQSVKHCRSCTSFDSYSLIIYLQAVSLIICKRLVKCQTHHRTSFASLLICCSLTKNTLSLHLFITQFG